MQLRDTRLRQPEHRADLLHGQLFPVVERDDGLLPFRQPRDRLGHQVHPLLAEQRSERIDLVRLERAVEVQPFLSRPEAQVLQAEEHHVADPGEQLLVVVERQTELARDLLLARRAAERAFQVV